MGMGVGRAAKAPLDFGHFRNKRLFLSFEWEKIKFRYFWPPLEKIWKNILMAPTGKNPPDAYVYGL